MVDSVLQFLHLCYKFFVLCLALFSVAVAVAVCYEKRC
jgi:hypothetical protein